LNCLLDGEAYVPTGEAYESFFGTLKRETGLGRWALANAGEVQDALYDWIEMWYNLKRRYTSLDYCSPVEFEIMKAAA